ncbi:hypothetical protein C8J57DRAFT_1267517, partial [Mycena rebaudengoi]
MALWNVTIDDTSPFFKYIPYADGSNSGLANGWIPWYSGSKFIAQNGEGGDGDSYHLTSLNGAQVNLVFYGTGVYLYGNTNGSYEITVDDQDFPSDSPTSSGLLFSGTGLKEGTHSVTLTVTSTGLSRQMAFDRAVISTPLVDKETPVETFFDNTDTLKLKYTGNWTTASAPGIPNSSVTHPWQETFDLDASVTMNMEPGTVGVSIWGMANWGNWLYTVSLDGDSEKTYNGSTFWKVPDALLFFQGGLDATKNHTVTLKNSTPKMKLALNSIRTYNLPSRLQSSSTSISASSSSTGASSSKHSPVSVGVIVGPILGVVALASVAVFLFWRFRSRRKAWLEDPNVTPEPYTDRSPHRPQFTDKYPVQLQSTTTVTTVAPASGDSATSTQSISPLGAPVRALYRGQKLPASSYATSSVGAVTDLSGSGHQLQPPAVPLAATTLTDGPTVDRLIELIAQRIDRGRHDDDSAPPEYRG